MGALLAKVLVYVIILKSRIHVWIECAQPRLPYGKEELQGKRMENLCRNNAEDIAPPNFPKKKWNILPKTFTCQRRNFKHIQYPISVDKVAI